LRFVVVVTQSTLETLRNALKNEVLPIWATLEGQVTELLATKGLPDLIVKALEGVVPLVAKVDNTAVGGCGGLLG